MSLSPGARVGSYEIIDLVGAGGMGEVYRARDVKLKREVAIKILPESLAEDSERIARFQREAELLASLNHENIAIVHDFEEAGARQFLVMEFVEGDTLTDRLKRGPLPLDEVLQIGKQIAEALEAAHQKGITHRDLKPSNIKIAGDGKVKVLDFGLAKMLDTPASLDASNSPTLMSGTAGMILGTAAYMSPEQARGKTVDRRTDIWALGCVLYQALTGRQAFAGENVSDTIAAVLRGEPDWSVIPAGTPRRLRDLLQRCLRKDPHQRLHDAADARIELEEAATSSEALEKPRAMTYLFAALAFALLAGAAIASAFWWTLRRPLNESSRPMHLSVELEPPAVSAATAFDDVFALSPDGQFIVYLATRDGKRQLFLRGIGDSVSKPISGTEDGVTPFFSPDGQWIGFLSGRELKKVPISGGSPTAIATISSLAFAGAFWDSDNRIVFVPDFNGGIWSVSANGGTPQLLLKTDVEKDRIAFQDPTVLPRAKGILFAMVSGHATTFDEVDIAVLEPGATEPRILLHGGTTARYVPTGHLVYVRGGSLFSVPFDLSRLAVTGTPVAAVEGLEKNAWGSSLYSVSDDGTLVYERAASVQRGNLLIQVDRKGNIQTITDGRSYPSEFALSPNGRQVAARVLAVNDDIWTYDVASGTPLRLTFEAFDEIFPVWTPDGRRIAFGSRTGSIFWKSSDGTGQREEISRGQYTRYPGSFSPDGKTLAFVEFHPSTQGDIWLIPLDGNRQAQPFQNTEADEWSPRFSPDGRWIAYASNETGRQEIYIRPIGSAGGRKRISTEGGTWPTWARNSREIFFANGDKIAAVTLDAEGNRIGQQRIVVDTPRVAGYRFEPDAPLYDVMPDDEHFVLRLTPQYASPTHYNLTLKWFSELQQHAPAK